jgi:hypothetical protein
MKLLIQENCGHLQRCKPIAESSTSESKTMVPALLIKRSWMAQTLMDNVELRYVWDKQALWLDRRSASKLDCSLTSSSPTPAAVLFE